MPYETPCLGCVMDEGFLEEKEVPVLGVTAGLTGIMMASFAIKHLTRLGRVIWGKRLIWDLYLEGFIEVELTKDPNCPVCHS
ncbi:MAG: adenylyltransferase, partial [Desulfatiglandales bacterium]